MAVSVKFDSTEIVDTTYTAEFCKHESATERILNKLELAREDGSILISDHRGEKLINCAGVLFASTELLLESAIDTFKELFSRQEKNLDILRPAAGTTRRYVATCISHDFNREYFHLKFVPWSATFLVLSGEGKDTALTIPLNVHNIVTTTPATHTVDLLGSKPPKPTILLEPGTTYTLPKGLQFENVDTGEILIVTGTVSMDAGQDLIIYCNEKKVMSNLNTGASPIPEVNFYGNFPTFKIGTNTFKLTVGGIVNQQNYIAAGSVATGYVLNGTAKYRAQSFEVPNTDGTFKGISLPLDKTGSPGTITWRIETDNAGKPSGTIAAGGAATGTITAGQVGATYSWIDDYAAAIYSLTANTKYWLVVYAAGVDVDNNYDIGLDPNKGYIKGKAFASDDSGSTWTEDTGYDMYFKILFGGEPENSAMNMTLSYYKTYL